jgi:Predicted phosphoesterases, related to the Icc protein
MKILAISDIESRYLVDYFDPSRFKDIDLILSAGDLKAHYLSYIVTMINKPLLYVHGNHDRTLLREPAEGCECIDDKVYEFNGLRIAGLGGCMTYNGGPLQFTDVEMSRRISKNKFKYRKGIDILLTHAPVFGIGDGKDQAHTGYKSFFKLLDKYAPAVMIHGHQHLNYGICEREHQYNETRIINAFDYKIIEL